VVGLAWTALLLASGSLPIFLAGSLAAWALAVHSCGVAERLLATKDPGSIVLDEITAVPVCWFGWAVEAYVRTGHIPAPAAWLSGPGPFLVAGVFAAFRLFDIWKPWPIRQSQALPGGLGIAVDDLLAAAYVNLLWIPAVAMGWLNPGTRAMSQ
jgi:phosphatidylglycerophosphatase A